jgi:hypothetical protein
VKFVVFRLPSSSFTTFTPAIECHGLSDSLHHLGIPCGLRGQYVYSAFPPGAPSQPIIPPLGKMLVILRDGRKLHGVLRSYDQFGMCAAATVHSAFPTTVPHSRLRSEPRPRGHSRANIPRERLCRELARTLSHSRRERRPPRRNRAYSPPPLPTLFLFCLPNHPDVSEKKDLDLEDDVPVRQVDYSVLEAYHKNDIIVKKRREEIKSQVLYEQKGFCKEGGEGDGY